MDSDKVTVEMLVEAHAELLRLCEERGAAWDWVAIPLRAARPVQPSAFGPDWKRAPEWATCAVLFEFGGNKYVCATGEWNFYEVEPTIDTNDYGVPRLNYIGGKWGPGDDPQRFEVTTPITIFRRPTLKLAINAVQEAEEGAIED